MSIKTNYYCDKCGKEITAFHSTVRIYDEKKSQEHYEKYPTYPYQGDIYEVCDECLSEIQKYFIKKVE